MSKNQTLLTNNKRDRIIHFGVIALVIALFISIATTSGMLPVLAAAGALDGVMDIVIDIISDAAFYIGIVIVLWGVFQIILAFRREDSEGISKQITTVVVGGVLVGFGSIANTLYGALKT
jgi:hypothetical protein